MMAFSTAPCKSANLKMKCCRLPQFVRFYIIYQEIKKKIIGLEYITEFPQSQSQEKPGNHKKSSMHGKIMEFEKKQLYNHGKIMEFCEII